MDATRSLPEATHSPVLSADLSIHGQRFTVAALGPDHLVVRSPRSIEPGEGTIRFTVDDQLTTYYVDLPEGIDPSRHEQAYRVLKTV